MRFQWLLSATKRFSQFVVECVRIVVFVSLLCSYVWYRQVLLSITTWKGSSLDKSMLDITLNKRFTFLPRDPTSSNVTWMIAWKTSLVVSANCLKLKISCYLGTQCEVCVSLMATTSGNVTMCESRAVHFTKRRHRLWFILVHICYSCQHSTRYRLPEQRLTAIRCWERARPTSRGASPDQRKCQKRPSGDQCDCEQRTERKTRTSQQLSRGGLLWLLPETSRCVRFRKFRLLVLRSESDSGKRTNLDTVAACNNRVHTLCSLYYCLFAPHIFVGVIFHAHPVSGESHIQCNANR